MASTIFTAADIKYLKEWVRQDVFEDFRLHRTVMSKLYGRGPIGRPVREPGKSFYWYTGHDPRNSVDNQAFMVRLIRRVG